MTAVLRVAVALLLLAAVGTVGAQAQKVLRYALGTPVSSLDPAMVSDVPTVAVLSNIFDPPYTYDYLARPAKLKPNTAAALPEVSADGRTLTLRIRPGIHFADDPVFNGAKRELTAADYVYSIKRHWDPKIKSPNLYLVAARIRGMAALRTEAEKTGRFDYDRDVEQLTVKGIATDDSGVTSVVVNGVPAALQADGTWEVIIPVTEPRVRSG